MYDCVGGDTAEQALRAIGWEGRFLVIGFTAGIPSIPLNLALLKSCQIIGVFYGAMTAREPEKSAAISNQLIDWVASGELRPHVSGRYPLERAGGWATRVDHEQVQATELLHGRASNPIRRIAASSTRLTSSGSASDHGRRASTSAPSFRSSTAVTEPEASSQATRLADRI